MKLLSSLTPEERRETMESYSVEAILSATDRNFTSTMKNADKTMSGLDSTSKKARTSILDIAKGMGVFSVIQGGINLAKNAVVGLGTELSASSATWKTFTGNMENLGKSKSEIASVKKELQDFATQTIYSASDMATTYSQLEAVGIKSSNKLVKGFGGLAAAAENPKQAMKTLSQQATQMAAKPTVQWMDFKLMLEQTPAGMAAVAKTMGMTTSELVKNVQDGTVKTQDFFDAVTKTGTNDTFGKMATQYKTVGQAMDGLKETLVTKLQPAFDKLSGVGIKAVEGIIGKLEKFNFDKFVSTISAGATKVIAYFSKLWESLKEGLKGFDTTGFKKVFETIASVAKVAFGVILAILPTVVEWIGKLATFFSKVVTAIQPFLPILLPIIGTWAAFMIQLKGIGTVIRMFNTFKTVISGVATTFKILTSIMAANPFTVIIGIIAALVAAFVYFYNTNEEFRNKVNQVWQSILDFIQPIVNTISEFIQSVFAALGEWWNTNQNTILSIVQTVWGVIQATFEAVVMVIQLLLTTFLAQMQSAWAVWSNVVSAIVQVAWALISNIFGGTLKNILSVVTTVINQIKLVIDTVMKVIQNLIKIVLSAIKGDWSGVLDGIKGIVGAFGDYITGTFDNVMGLAKDLIQNGIDTIKGIFESLSNINLLDIGKAIMDGFLKGLKEKYEGVKDFIGGIGDWIRDHKGPIRVDRKLLIPAGNAIMEGLNNGLDNGFDAVQSNVSSMADRLTTNFDVGGKMAQMNGSIDGVVQHEVSYGSHNKPAVFNVNIGNQSFKAFVDDISQAQGNDINLNLQF